jgi:hypothetical protein
VALVASLGLLHPQILSLEVVLFKGGRSMDAAEFRPEKCRSKIPAHRCGKLPQILL